MKRFNFRTLAVLFGLLLALSACDKKEIEVVEPEPEEPTKPPTPKPLTFFYAGYSYGTDYKAADRRAILSINDSVVRLSPNMRSDAVAVSAVNSKEAHLTGYQVTAAGNKRAVYWKNNKIQYLSGASKDNTGSAIHVVGSKVYIGGRVDTLNAYKLVLWTNGVASRKGCCLVQSGLNSISESNGKPVVAGRFASNAFMFVNGMGIALAGPNTYADYIHAIGTDIYVLGKETVSASSDAAMVWKNDKEVFRLPFGDFATDVLGTMAGKDYYFVANIQKNGKRIAVVYKNKTKLYQLSHTQNLEATAIQVVAGKVYVLGNYQNGQKSTGVLWTNGKPKVLFAESKKIYLHDFVIK